MSYYDWTESKKINDAGHSFNALVFALFERTPRDQLGRLKQAFPKHWNEYKYRESRPGGVLPTDPPLASLDTGIVDLASLERDSNLDEPPPIPED